MTKNNINIARSCLSSFDEKTARKLETGCTICRRRSPGRVCKLTSARDQMVGEPRHPNVVSGFGCHEMGRCPI